jgi:formamidopyrimidine-DNA glycosylase
MLKHPQAPAGRFEEDLTDRTFESVERVGKYLLFTLDDGCRLLAHLGMTGKFIVSRDGMEPTSHLCSRYIFEDGSRLDHVDVRRFGRLELYRPGERIEVLERLGDDPLSSGFSSETLKKLVYSDSGKRRRKRAVHTLLLDQSLVSGVGNIYASEALFRAGIRPTRQGGKLKPIDRERLCRGLRGVMEEALRCGGTTINDYRRVDDKPGSFKEMLQVYGRGGEACRLCGKTIRKLTLGDRSVYFCPRCQPR